MLEISIIQFQVSVTQIRCSSIIKVWGIVFDGIRRFGSILWRYLCITPSIFSSKQKLRKKQISLIFVLMSLIVYLILTKCNRWNETLGTMVIIQNWYQQQKRKKLTLSCKRFRKSQYHETKHCCSLCEENLPHSVAPCFKLFCNGN